MTFNIWRPKIISARMLEEAGVLPRGYGVAWWLQHVQLAYCLPIPFNRIVGAFRAWYLEWRRPCEDDPIAQAYEDGREQGIADERCRDYDAYQAGYEAGARLSDIFIKDIRRQIAELSGDRGRD